MDAPLAHPRRAEGSLIRRTKRHRAYLMRIRHAPIGSEWTARLIPYVFISHLSEDNSRLAIYVARLLEALDESVEVWIDTPERVTPDLGSNVRVKSTPPGTQWNKEIETAVENASCVLAFWSASFPLRGSRNKGHDFGRVHLRDFLSGLACKVQKRPATMVEHQRIRPTV